MPAPRGAAGLVKTRVWDVVAKPDWGGGGLFPDAAIGPRRTGDGDVPVQ